MFGGIGTSVFGRRGQRGIRAWGVAVTLGLTSLCAVIVVDDRRSEWSQAERSSRNVLEVVAHAIEREVSSYDLSLQAAVHGMNDAEVMSASSNLRRRSLFDGSSSAEGYSPILLANPSGAIVDAPQSVADSMPTMNVRDRVYFRVHSEREDAGLYVDGPVVSRLSGKTLMPLTRRLSKPDGSFAGVAVGGIRTEYLNAMLRMPDLGHDGSVNLFTLAGDLVARSPALPDGRALNISGSTQLAHYRGSASGTFVATSIVDGTERFYTYRRLSNLPLTLSVAISVNGVLANWWRKTVVIGASVFILATALLLLFRRLGNELHRRSEAEAAALEANRKLSKLAATDGLTGLANRRTFDEELAAAVAESARSGAPLSLAMVDADNFKRFNDRHGHLAGDVALRCLARALSDMTGKDGETAARYGGEEFAVILPGHDLQAAFRWADVAGAAVRSSSETAGPGLGVTVSVGLAAWRPGLEPEGLVAQADAGLYAAKAAGRNCARAAGPDGTPYPKAA